MGLIRRFGDWRRYRRVHRLEKRGEEALTRMNRMRGRFKPQREEEGEVEEEEEEDEDDYPLSDSVQLFLFQKKPPERLPGFTDKEGNRIPPITKITQGEWDAANNWVYGSAVGLCKRAFGAKEIDPDKASPEMDCVKRIKDQLDEKRANYIHGLRKRLKKVPTKRKVAKQMLAEFIGPQEKRYLGRRMIQKVIPLKDERR